MKLILPALALVVLFSGLVFVCLPVQAAEVGGVISQDTTWTAANSPYTITKNTLISTGVTLTVEPGATVNINSGCYLQINGTLIAKGTAGSKITFNGGQIKLNFATSYNEQTGSGSIIENCIFTSNQEQQLSIKSSSPKIDNNIFNSQVYIGQHNGTVFGNTFNAPLKVSGGSIVLTQNLFKQGLQLVELPGPNVQVLENTFTGYSDGAGISIGANDLNGQCSLKIERNLISNNKYGISDDTINSPTIRYNTVVNNNVGITLLDGKGQNYRIEYNTINNEQDLVLRPWTGCPDIDVSNNYWGTTDTSQIDNSIYDYYDDFNLGKVNYQPILNQPNGNAPVSDLPTVTPTPIPATTPSATAQPATTPAQTNMSDPSSFNIQTNSSLTAFSFDSNVPQISFYVSGPEGTTGYVRLTIAKTLMPTADQIQVYLDGNRINREVTSNGDSWQVTFTYHHSSHQVTINSAENSALPGWVWTAAAIAAALAIAVTLGMIVFLKRETPRIDNPN
jgi:hypothetical protein